MQDTKKGHKYKDIYRAAKVVMYVNRYTIDGSS